tara:strand:- start:12249 stop:16142 length:3894 start_codon:yes stop_codon:yes gene_type:complete
MKYLIYELFSGVGFCNQLFSLETAIYMANILKRKLVLLVRNPLCHCGRSSWEYGLFLEFFSDDYKIYLPHGFEVYYKDIPQHIETIINKQDECYNLFYNIKLSYIAIIDKQLATPENELQIEKFSNFRKRVIFDSESMTSQYVYINRSNASRCFYNFYTTQENYKLMSNICKSLTHLHPAFNLIDYKITGSYNALHLRLGDRKHNKQSIDENSLKYYDNLKNVLQTISTNKATLFLMADRQDGEIIDLLKKEFTIIDLSQLVKEIEYQKYFKNIKKTEVIEFLLQKNICKNSDTFIGCEGSTVSNYIQYIQFLNHKQYNLYSNRCLNKINDRESKEYTWNINSKCDGAVLGYKLFFPDNIKLNDYKMITLTNDGYQTLTHNLLISMKSLGIEKELKLYCIGNKCYDFFKEHYPENELVLIENENKEMNEWVQYKSIQNPDEEGKKKWSNITSYKIKCIHKELFHNDVIFVDGDIVFERNPIYFLVNAARNNELVIQNDNCPNEKKQFCTGFFYMKSNDNTKNITNIDHITEWSEFRNDQQYLRLFEDKLKVEYLPLDGFPNGMHWRKNNPPYPYIIHFNYDVSHQKINRIKRYNKWYVENPPKFEKYFMHTMNVNFSNYTPFTHWLHMCVSLKDVIINASVTDKSDSFTPTLPIGVQHDFLKYVFSPEYKNFFTNDTTNTKLCLCAVRRRTDSRRFQSSINRGTIVTTVGSMPFVTQASLPPNKYFEEIQKYKFVICPEGNGIDTHRLWEALYSKGIPIVEKNPLMEEKLRGLPILWTTDYSELTEEYLNNKYQEIMKSNYNFTSLYLSNYTSSDQLEIYNRSKFWCYHRELNELFDRYYSQFDLSRFKIMPKYDTYFGLNDGNGIPLDKKLETVFNKMKNGIFIDVGAHDGIKQNNTFYFEKNLGWNGLLITPNRELHKECVKNRPNSLCDSRACVSCNYELNTVSGDFWRLEGSIDCNRSKHKNKETVLCTTLTTIIDSHVDSFKQKFNKDLEKGIDFLNIDTSAMEYEIICGLDFNKYKISYILIEILTWDYEKIRKHLEENNFELMCNLSNYTKENHRRWDGTHNDYLFRNKNIINESEKENENITSYSQLGQDLNIMHFYNKKKQGYFVDVGAYDGIKFSNTYMLEKDFDWNGICVEPGKNFFEKLKSCRKAYCVNKAVYSESNLELDFLDCGNDDEKGSMLSGLKDTSKDPRTKCSTLDTYKVNTITMNDLLTEANAPSFIEYISIDVEGAEMEVLKSIDFTKYTFGYISLECNNTKKQCIFNSYLEKYGYIVNQYNKFDIDYIHKSMKAD